jgi:hypothetical protein
MPVNLIGEFRHGTIFWWPFGYFDWTAFGTLILAAATVFTLLLTFWETYRREQRRKEYELKREKRQTCTQLEGRKHENWEIFMSFILTRIKSEGSGILAERYRDGEYEMTVFHNEYYRLRESAGYLLVDLAKSEGRVVDTLSMIDLLSTSENIHNNIEQIIQNINKLRVRLNDEEYQFTKEYVRELEGLEDNSGNLPGRKATEIMDKLIKEYSDKLSKWYIENIDELIDDIIKAFKREINEMNKSKSWWQSWRR